MLPWLAQLWGGAAGGGGHAEPEERGAHDGAEDDEVPEEFVDPISFACMQDPALLCGTGQIYCLATLRTWLATGSRTCPKTNIVMRDVEVVRLPSMRARIAAWHEARGLPPLPPLDPPPEVLHEAGEQVPALLAQLRGGDVYRRGLAAGELNNMLIEWGAQAPTQARQRAMEAMLLDLVWLLRQGDPYGSGVAAAALSQFTDPHMVALLAAVAAMPAVALLWSPHSYGQHSAARLLGRLARATSGMPTVLTEAGAVRGLLQQLDLSAPFSYSRCSAAATLATLCECEEAQGEARAGNATRLLKALVLQAEDADARRGSMGEHLLRFEKRDAASCLLALPVTEAELAEAPAVDLAHLMRYSNCSHAWLRGDTDDPNEGYNEQELEAGQPEDPRAQQRGQEVPAEGAGAAGDGDGQ